MKYTDFKQDFLQWFRDKSDVNGVLIIGSYTRDDQKPDSDIDAVVLCLEPKKYVDEQSWISHFGEVNNVKSETWGVVKTVRASFKAGLEIEFNFSTLAWADIPVDPGTRRVAADGIEILYDPTGRLLRLKNEVKVDSNTGT